MSLYAKPCMTDIYFGNGVWNTHKQALDNRNALREFMLSRANIRLDIGNEGIVYEFKLAYNPSRGSREDLMETYWQLKESGQITFNYFSWMSALLNNDEETEPLEKFREIVSNYSSDAWDMWQIYENESFNQKHNVLLVAHSQGNLFGNKMYMLMNDAQKQKFRMVSVATPANSVAGDGPYVTVYGDFVINRIPDALPGNEPGFGHSFVSTYLNGLVFAPQEIALNVKSAYDSLAQNTTCAEYRMVKVIMPSFGQLEILGQPINTWVFESAGETTLEQYDHYIDEDGYPSCGMETTYYSDGQVWNSYWGTHDNKNISWLPARVTSKSELDERIDVKQNIYNVDTGKCITISLEEEGELYSIISELFPD